MIKVSKMFGGTHGSRALACAIATGLTLASSITLDAGVDGRGGGRRGGRARAVVPPPNNDCANAIVIVEGDPAISFSTVDATTDGPGDCLTKNEIWYRYQSLSVKQVTVSLCGSNYDTHLSIYDGGTCPPTVLLDCNDDSPACASAVHSQVVFLSVVGAEYLIRVGGFFGRTGTGTLTVTAFDLPGINDECPQALEIFDGPKPFSTVGTTDSEPPLPPVCEEFGSLMFGADIWYTYVATCNGTLTVNQCDINFDGRMAAYWGHNCPPDDADIADCDDDACAGASGAIMTIDVPCGDLLTIRVGGWGGAEFGPGTLVLTCVGGPCAPPCPWDLDGDGDVQMADLMTLIEQWRTDPGGPPDFDGDGVVAVPDLLEMLARWGVCP